MDWTLSDIPDLSNKVIVITGANSGIGLEAAKILAEKGAEIVLACRSISKGEHAREAIQQKSPQARTRVMELDLADLSSVSRFAGNLTQDYEKLDVLINNAGVMAPPFARTADGFESQFGTNHLGHFALTGQLLRLLEASGDGRVVVVSSIAHRVGRIAFSNLNAERRYSRWPAYAQSKLANLMFAQELQRRLAESGSSVRAVAVHPGYSATNLQRHMLAGGLFNGLVAQSQEQGCLPTVRGATDPSLSGGEYLGPHGWLELRGRPTPARIAPAARDRSKSVRLWDVSQQLVGLEYLDSPGHSVPL